MKFLNNSVDYCEEYEFKKILSKYIEKYNIFLNNKKNHSENYKNDGLNSKIYIPNNNKKYYVYITKKKNLNSSKSDYTTMYFFADTLSKKYYQNFLLIKNTIIDFFLECDLSFKEDYILEGYLYGSNLYASNNINSDTNGKMHYLITDILFKGDTLVDLSYNQRFDLINDLFFSNIAKMKNINNLLHIGIHSCINENFIPIFLNNFIWKNEIICIENINNFTKNQKYIKNNDTNIDEPSSLKKIVKTKISDVFKVFNIETNDAEGILYINTLKMSRYINTLFSKCEELKLKCTFNSQFQKWQIVVLV
jgi:hypothetical protein